MGRKGPRAKTKTVLKPVKQWEKHGSMPKSESLTFLNKNHPNVIPQVATKASKKVAKGTAGKKAGKGVTAGKKISAKKTALGVKKPVANLSKASRKKGMAQGSYRRHYTLFYINAFGITLF